MVDVPAQPPRSFLGDAGRAFAVALRSRSLARAELAFGSTCMAELAFMVGLGVVAFEDGGASRVGLVGALRLAPSAVLAPVAATLADRWPRERVLAASSALVATSTAASAVVLAVDGPTSAVYAFAALTTIALTPYRAAHTALLPSLCTTTTELAASNVTRGLVESLGVVAGPLLAAGLLSTTGPWGALAAAAGSATIATVLVARLPYERPPLPGAPPGRLATEVRHGLRQARANTDVVALTGFTALQTFLRGALAVFTVVLAIDVLARGDAAVGVLQAALGIGAIAGSIAAARVVHPHRMAAWFGAAVALWGLPIVAVGVWPSFLWAWVMLAVIGVANAILDVALFTMMGRLISDEVLARVLGVFESTVAVSVALGSVAAAVAVDQLGLRGAMVLLGAIAPVAIGAGWHRLARIDDVLVTRQREIDVLRRVPMLRALPVPTIENLARRLQLRHLEPGEVVIEEGSDGTEYYVIASGDVEVRAGDTLRRMMGPGEGFGEISLLRATPRTATVRAGPEPVLLYALERDDFVRALGFSAAARAADDAIARWESPQ